MKYAIVVSSQTGNTDLLAKAIEETLPKEMLIYSGKPKEDALQADMLFVGFWTDKGTCDEATKAFLSQLHGKQIFLFGTAGFGGDSTYFDQIISRVKQGMDSSNTILHSYMCQGKMPLSVRARYVKMAEGNPALQAMVDNFDKALSHPDEQDLSELKQLVAQLL